MSYIDAEGPQLFVSSFISSFLLGLPFARRLALEAVKNGDSHRLLNGGTLEPLGTTRLHQRLRDIIDSRHWSLCVTLTTGDVLFGDFYGLNVPIDNPHGIALHVPSYLDERSRSLGFAFRLEPFEIVYNNTDGSVHGSASVVVIPNDRVAAIETVWWDVASRTGFKNIPNPYASLVWNHNEAVAQRIGLDRGGIAEFALSTSHVTTEDIHFTNQQLLYADYAYFEWLPSTSFYVGLFGAGAGVTAGIDSLVLSVLQGDFTGRVRIPGTLRRHLGFIERFLTTLTPSLKERNGCCSSCRLRSP